MTDIHGNSVQIVDSNKESNTTGPVQAQLTADQLLAALDAQIRFVTDSQRNEGLTRWAIWGALAAIIWIATDVLKSSDLMMPRAVFMACGFFVVWVMFEEIAYLLSPNSSMEIGPTRFHLSTDLFGTIRTEVVASGLRHVLIFIALIQFQFSGVIFLWAYTVIALLWGVMFFVVGMTGIPFPKKFDLPAALTVRTLLHIVFLIAVGLQIAQIIAPNWNSYTMVDVRLALLLNAGFYLLIRLATASSSEHLLSQLTQLRQHIAFGRISTAEGNRKAEILLSGLKAVDVLQPLMEEVREKADELHPILTNYQNSIQKISQQLTTLKAHPVSENENRLKLAEVLRLIDELATPSVIIRMMKSVTRPRNRFIVRAIAIAIYSPECRAEVKVVADDVGNIYAKVIATIQEFSKQYEFLKKDANEFAKYYSNNPDASLETIEQP